MAGEQDDAKQGGRGYDGDRNVEDKHLPPGLRPVHARSERSFRLGAIMNCLTT